MDACGYIGADAAVKLYRSVLARGGPRLHEQLGAYHTNACVEKGNDIVGKPSGYARLLETEDVNALVHAYANRKNNPQAQEDWWGGAVAWTISLQESVNSLEAQRAVMAQTCTNGAPGSSTRRPAHRKGAIGSQSPSAATAPKCRP